MTKLHIFDMDGTLLAGSACLEVSRHLGVLNAINVIEEAWGRGEVGHVEFYELCLPLWEGLTEHDVDQSFAATAWLDGIPCVWADIARRMCLPHATAAYNRRIGLPNTDGPMRVAIRGPANAASSRPSATPARRG